jgi:hypothetical protein
MLSQSKLAEQLESMVPVGSEPEAINNLAAAWEKYFVDASVLLAPTAPGSLAGAMAAFRGALAGMSVPGAGVAILQAALTAFWGGVVLSAGAIWPGSASATPPPGLAGLPAALAPTLANNLASNASLKSASSAIAAVLHASAGLGGTVISGSPPPVPIA